MAEKLSITKERTAELVAEFGKGVQGVSLKENDFVENLFVASTHDYVLFFTNLGKVYRLKVHELPVGSRTTKGSAIIAVVRCWLYRRQTARVTARRQTASSRAPRTGQQKQRASTSRAHRPQEYRSESTSTSIDSARTDSRRSSSPSRRHQPRSYETNRSSRVSSRYEDRYEGSDVSRRQHDAPSRPTHQVDRDRYRDQSPTYPSKKFTPRTYRPDDGASSLPPRTTRPRHSRRD